MEHENAYSLMMDVLDGELAAHRQGELEAHLRACPTCMREWHALQAIDTLFRQTPALSPAVGFTQRTLASLPNRTYQIWTISAIYMMLLLAGTLPILIGFLVATTLGPILREPALLRGGLQTAERILQVAGTVFGALLDGAGQFVLEQPMVIGWLLVLVGIVSLWSGVYRQVLSPQVQRQIGS